MTLPACWKCGGTWDIVGEARCLNCGNRTIVKPKNNGGAVDETAFKVEDLEPPKRGKGRPAGMKNKPKKDTPSHAIPRHNNPGQNGSTPDLTPRPAPVTTPEQVKEDPVPPRSSCPIEKHPLIMFLAKKWEDLEDQIETLNKPIDQLREDQRFLERLAREFRDDLDP